MAWEYRIRRVDDAKELAYLEQEAGQEGWLITHAFDVQGTPVVVLRRSTKSAYLEPLRRILALARGAQERLDRGEPMDLTLWEIMAEVVDALGLHRTKGSHAWTWPDPDATPEAARAAVKQLRAELRRQGVDV